MASSTHAGGLVLVLALLVPVAARADAIGIGMDCPSGTTGDGCHGAEFCRVQTCSRDSECAAGLRCIDVLYCVRSMSCFGRDGMGTPVTDHYRLCGDSPCPEGGCEPARVCATPPVTPVDAGRPRDSGPRAGDAGSGRSHARYGCGCEVPGTSRSPLIPLTLLGITLGAVAIVLARRRR
jgi:hypothetical protein